LELREIDVGEEAHVGSQPVLHGDEALAGERFGERGAGAPRSSLWLPKTKKPPASCA
jgi:hypothetical protein